MLKLTVMQKYTHLSAGFVVATLILSVVLASAAEAANRKVEAAIKRSRANKALVNDVVGHVADLTTQLKRLKTKVVGNAGTIDGVTTDLGYLAEDIDLRLMAIEETLCGLQEGHRWNINDSVCKKIQDCHPDLVPGIDIGTGSINNITIITDTNAIPIINTITTIDTCIRDGEVYVIYEPPNLHAPANLLTPVLPSQVLPGGLRTDDGDLNDLRPPEPASECVGVVVGAPCP